MGRAASTGAVRPLSLLSPLLAVASFLSLLLLLLLLLPPPLACDSHICITPWVPCCSWTSESKQVRNVTPKLHW